MKRIIQVVLCLTLPLLSVFDEGSAQTFPTKPINVVVSAAAGGTTDVPTRILASKAEKLLGQPVIVTNKPGATGMIGRVAVTQAAPDGYTLGICSTAMTCNVEWEIANGRNPAVTRYDFIPIGSYGMSPFLVVVPYNSSWRTLNDLINDCRAKPNHYAFGSAGLYGDSHIGCEILTRANGIRCRHVPFKGGGPTLTALVGGHIDFATQFPTTSIPLARGNKLRVLAVQSDKRHKFIPDAPTVRELGIDAQWITWRGFVVSQKTPEPIVKKLRDITTRVFGGRSFVDAIEKLGDEVHPVSGVELANYWTKESEKIGKLMKEMLKEARSDSSK